jgi:hypothetical protein
MVIDEKTQEAQVSKVFIFSVETSLDVAHELAASKNIVNCVVHWVVEKSSHVVLVGTHISWVSVEALPHLKNTGSCTKLAPKRFRNFRNCVNPDSVKAESLN